ncbi:FxsA family protein [Aggregatibacter segnis]|uniref:FxsA cytoplasmic membrane protein (Suppressor of F exclusion of phage T7) n=1 Tax=Aggregatibacter segnis ATCC 33393 TaxID=888057 RepID=E6KVB1_9PAST|nr:FxsA family protein [Aggregatibacter segnis]EFU68220.1 FxsA cytoplasmic membrane protein (suppressor of F exclusion of phage T7) [Aggregatibacter segnis ATCC 33393]QQB10138.1 membrane protein FxsA [Aggregatibacter segnis]SQH64083.1 Suppressor of F exclusion of phage T7 [Aggregatibacter segnis ATCC 33393]
MPFITFLFAVFVFIYLELSLLVWLGSRLGILMLILLLIGSSLLGIVIIRVRGWYSLTRVKQQLTQGELPTDALFGSLRWLIAGILFVIPGFVTDILACVLLSPLGRYLVNTFIRSRFVFFQQNIFKTNRTFYSSQGNPPRDGEIFEAEFEKEADENKRLK